MPVERFYSYGSNVCVWEGVVLEHDGSYTSSQGRRAATRVFTLHICKCTYVQKYAGGRIKAF